MATIRILCWNVLATPHTRYNAAFHGQATVESEAQKIERYSRNKAIIDQTAADVVCLQEADDAFVSMLQPAHTILRHFLNGNREGTALLALVGGSLEVTGATSLDLQWGKSAVFAFLRSPAFGGAVWLASMHLSGGPHALDARIAQLQTVRVAMAAAAGSSSDGLVLCGDFNDTDPDAMQASVAEGARLRRAPGDVGSASGLTADFLHATRIDHVVISAEAQGRVHGVQLPFAPGNPWRAGADVLVGSDHVPLIFDIAL